ncbi:MAG: ATP-binding cassette domain-containing protein [Clostridia bacterium]|nr:ATP-binding cassette domain-containing protein [Clostridia bacterium]MDD4387349.1 ATP-binding cassette domain-containing protein [Clostridia bacterium]
MNHNIDERLIKVYNANNNNLKSISLNIPLGKYITFIGKSGSGKSTLAIEVIYSGYFEKKENIHIPVEPCLLEQRVYIQKTNQSIGKFLFNVDIETKTLNEYLLDKGTSKININFRNSFFIKVVKLLSINMLLLDSKITELSLSTYNKLRFLKLLLLIKKEKLLIIDEIGSGLSYAEAKDISYIFKELVILGFTVIAIEHSIPLITESDYIVEMGPGAGENGGKVIYCGDTKSFLYSENSLINTINKHKNKMLNSDENMKNIVFENVTYRTFKDSNLKIPLGKLVCISGSTGSGKTVMLEIIQKLTDKSSQGWKKRVDIKYTNIRGKENIRRPHMVDQKCISTNIRSIPLTYINNMDILRDYFFSKFSDKKFHIGDFSFNSTGMCTVCMGKGYITEKINNIDIQHKCNICNGKRYKDDLLNCKIDEYSIGDVLSKTVLQALEIYKNWKLRCGKLTFLCDVGLEYLCIGQPSSTLSGGESQRIKISKELAKKLGDRSLYILDTPSRGLHISDVDRISYILKYLISKNNSVIIADNNLLLISNCDWVIHLDKEGNNKTTILYQGPPSNMPTKIKEQLGLHLLD